MRRICLIRRLLLTTLHLASLVNGHVQHGALARDHYQPATRALKKSCCSVTSPATEKGSHDPRTFLPANHRLRHIPSRSTCHHIWPVSFCLRRYSAAQPSSFEFHVAPGGSDRNIGSVEKPFRSFERARDAVRALRREDPALADTVRVFFHEGRYTIEKPLALGPDDSGTLSSPTLYAAYANERPVISGGVQVTGWKRAVLGGKSVWSAPLPGVVRRLRPEVQELWINGVRRSPARHPDKGYHPRSQQYPRSHPQPSG